MIGISLICTTSFPQSSPIHSCIRMVHTVAVVLSFCHSCYHDRATESLNINSKKFEFIYWLGTGRYAFTMKNCVGNGSLNWKQNISTDIKVISFALNFMYMSFILPPNEEHPVFNLNGFMYTWIGRLLLLPRLPPQFYFCW